MIPPSTYNHSLRFQSVSPAETKRIAQELSTKLRGGEIFLLSGEMGIGKTVFVKGIAIGLGIDERTITSPTFTLMCSHTGRLILHHIDLYRLASAPEIDALGLDDFVGEPRAVTVVEWGERVESVRWDGTVIRVHLRRGTRGIREISVSSEGAEESELEEFRGESEPSPPLARRRL